ncbi:hypothetical protein ILUMI_25022 [Ignelater luminosus]|uniref:Uncharacterized protein n=1 Tax=Ignelater luminosus TaxID=2038154 RepID=A0A8K0CAS2_IGNLU|nr:hypothetical protein ILUMI_25022 [Ignelater luminosus]
MPVDLISEDVFIKARADCQKETGVVDELIDKAEFGEFPDDKDFKCFVKCFHTQVGYLNDAGEPQLEIIKENLPENYREKANTIILEKCVDVQGDPWKARLGYGFTEKKEFRKKRENGI